MRKVPKFPKAECKMYRSEVAVRAHHPGNTGLRNARSQRVVVSTPMHTTW